MPDCSPNWEVVPSTNVEGDSNELFAIDAISASDVWAVGLHNSHQANSVHTLIEHWDGSLWSIVPHPNVGLRQSFFYGVTAISSSDVWAVGYYLRDNISRYRTLIEHWDGTTWSVVPSPNSSPTSGQDNNLLLAVDAVSSSDVWAVGVINTTGYFGPYETLTLHWNGNVWSVVPSPNLGTTTYLSAVTAISASDAWAVGYSITNIYQTLTLHWDGSVWGIVPSPNPQAGNELMSVDAISSNDVWAVGTTIMHWDGGIWSVVPSPSVGGLRGVAAVSTADVWAVGSRVDNGYEKLALHWNGSTWSEAPNPGVGGLNGVAALSSSDVWGAGAYGDTITYLSSTLVERYNPCPMTPTPTVTPTPEPPRCPGERFTDVCPTDYFYAPVLALNDDAILSGYTTSPPCTNNLWIPCFNPYSSSTRGQISKIVSLAAGFNDPVSGQTFEDAPPNSTFYTYIQRMAARNIINGYACGGPGEPCNAPNNLPYFRPGNTVTRGQLSKMVSLAFNWNEPVTGQQFQDVPAGSTFYDYVSRLYSRTIISGYPCGSTGEPCIGPGNLPYFRPSSNVTRGQTAKIVQLARTQPTPTLTPGVTPSPTTTTIPTTTPAITPSITPAATSTPSGTATSIIR
ncbi:MAG: S-layer homology domain-containing protein [Chloroflexota bacterium]